MRGLLAVSAFALVAGSALAPAQDKAISPGPQPPAKQSAPSESTDAPGHDAQSGRPATGELTKGAGGRGAQNDPKDDSAEQRGAPPTAGSAGGDRR